MRFIKSNNEIIKKSWPTILEINKLFENYHKFTDEQLINETYSFKKEIVEIRNPVESRIIYLREKLRNDLSNNEWKNIADELEILDNQLVIKTNAILNTLLPKAFAVIKETCKRLVGREWVAGGIKLCWNMIPFDIQLLGGLLLHQGKIVEMATGQGKTLIASMPAYLNALVGEGVHIITANDYLVKRDYELMSEIFKFHNLSVGYITNEMNNNERRKMYECDITYSTSQELCFDYLRDNMVVYFEYRVQKKHNYAIIDEVDHILIDEARTPLIISDIEKNTFHNFDTINSNIRKLVEKQITLVAKYICQVEYILNRSENITEEELDFAGICVLRAYRGFPKDPKLIHLLNNSYIKTLLKNKIEKYKNLDLSNIDYELYYIVNENRDNIEITVNGKKYLNEVGISINFDSVEQQNIEAEILNIDNNETINSTEKEKRKNKLIKSFEENNKILNIVNQLLKGYNLYVKDVHYIVRDNKIIIIDELTGRTLPGRSYGNGLQQAIEAKENIIIHKKSLKKAEITLQNYFHLYNKLSGMSATAEFIKDEFKEIYQIDVIVLPPHRVCIRNDMSDVFFDTQQKKYEAIINEILEMNKLGRPVLVAPITIEVSEILSEMLTKREIKHEILSAKQTELESVIIAKAGKEGAVTIATNMAGRGTDIKLGSRVADLGGLHVIGIERNISRRIDNQVIGRAGRQGDPGSSKIFLSLDDNLFGLLDEKQLKKVYKLFKNAKQSNRMRALSRERLKIEILEMAKSTIKNIIELYFEKQDENYLKEQIKYSFLIDVDLLNRSLQKLRRTELENLIFNQFKEFYELKEKKYGSNLLSEIERYGLLCVIDDNWVEHLNMMDSLKDSIIDMSKHGDPLVKYREQSYKMFESLMEKICKDVVQFILKFTTRNQ